MELLLKHAHTLVPGISRVDAIYRTAGRDVLQGKCVTLNNGRGMTETLMVEENLPAIEKLRKGKSPYNWFAHNEIPYHIDDGLRRVGGMFDELEKVVLMLRIANTTDGLSDLMFFYFSADLRNFGPAGPDTTLSTSHKELMAKMLTGAISTVLQVGAADRDTWQMFSQMIADNRLKLHRLQQQLDEVSRRYEERVLDTCNHYLAELSGRYGKKYVFGKSAIRLINAYNGDYYKIENAVRQAVHLANMLFADADDEAVEITADLINFSAPEPDGKIEEKIADSIYEKPFRYLDMLETAAQNVRDRNMAVTSQHVADALEKPVKPPAITWAINKHMKNIQQLFKLYPDKWPVIRSEFKPILRITA